MPEDFDRGGAIILASLRRLSLIDTDGAGTETEGLSGWAIMPMADYVG